MFASVLLLLLLPLLLLLLLLLLLGCAESDYVAYDGTATGQELGMTVSYSYSTHSTDSWTAVPHSQQHVVVCQSCT